MFITLSNQSLIAFALASLLLAAAPGPGVAFLVNRTLSEGRRAGLAATLGVAFGNFGNALGASIGIATLLALVPALLGLIQWLGGLYLLVLAALTLRNRNSTDFTAPNVRSLRPHFRDGFWVALLNPKTMLFFAAFLPQFLNQTTLSWEATLGLGIVFVIIAALSDGAYVFASAALSKKIRHSNFMATRWKTRWSKAGRWITALVYFTLAAYAITSGVSLLQAEV